MEDLNALPYLDAVVRETLRIHPPVVNTTRVDTTDDSIPVWTPYVDRFANVQRAIRYRLSIIFGRTTFKHFYRVTKGDRLDISIQILSRSRKVWGEDAAEFK
jgi:hypothetical protein